MVPSRYPRRKVGNSAGSGLLVGVSSAHALGVARSGLSGSKRSCSLGDVSLPFCFALTSRLKE